MPPRMAVILQKDGALNFAFPPALVMEQEQGAAEEVEEKTRQGDTFNIRLSLFPILDPGLHPVKK